MSAFLFALIMIIGLLPTVTAKTPIVIDADVGDYMDDLYAIAIALQRPEFDIKLILTASANTYVRAQVIAKFLIGVGRDDIPIGIGEPQNTTSIGILNNWRGASSFDLSRYPGMIYQDGVGRLIEMIEESPDVLTVITLAPVSNFKELLRRRPDLAPRLRIYAFLGSFNLCYEGVAPACPETNVVGDVEAATLFFQTAWNYTLVTPVDSSFDAILNGEVWQTVYRSNKRLVRVLIDAAAYWYRNAVNLTISDIQFDPVDSSTYLFDPMTVYSAWSTEYLEIIRAPVEIRNGVTVVGGNGPEFDIIIGFQAGARPLWNKLIADTLIGRFLPRNAECVRHLRG